MKYRIDYTVFVNGKPVDNKSVVREAESIDFAIIDFRKNTGVPTPGGFIEITSVCRICGPAFGAGG